MSGLVFGPTRFCDVVSINSRIGTSKQENTIALSPPISVVDHLDEVGTSSVDAASTTSSFSTELLASRDLTMAITRRDEKHSSFGIWCGLYMRFDHIIPMLSANFCFWLVNPHEGWTRNPHNYMGWLSQTFMHIPNSIMIKQQLMYFQKDEALLLIIPAYRVDACLI